MNFLIISMALLLGADPTVEQQGQLVQIRKNVDAIVELTFQLGQAKKDATALGPILLEQMAEAERVSGGRVKTLDDLYHFTGRDNVASTPWEQFKGLVTFANIMWTIGAILVGSALIWLFGHYFLELILLIPGSVWEGILYVGLTFLTCLASAISPEWQLALLMPIAIGFVGAVALTCKLHGNNSKSYEVPSLMLTAIWSIMALTFGSHVIGFMAVMAALSALGFICGHFPGCVYMGFNEEDAIPRTTLAAGLMLLLHVLLTVTGLAAEQITVFREGMNFMGSFVYFLGILIMSSKYYCWNSKERVYMWSSYGLMQMLVLVSGVAALYFGSVFGMTALMGFGGTIFAIYILEKYYELPWKGIGWAWSLLGLGILLYGIGVIVKMCPQYFLFG